jgi:hypothetical protein
MSNLFATYFAHEAILYSIYEWQDVAIEYGYDYYFYYLTK